MTKHDLSTHHFQRKISDFREVRIALVASQRVLESIQPYLIGLVVHRLPPPIVSGRMDWAASLSFYHYLEHVHFNPGHSRRQRSNWRTLAARRF